MNGYELFTKSDERGIAVYVHKSLKSRLSKINDTVDFKENIWTDVGLHGSDKLLLGCIYRSPNSSDENNDKLCQRMSNIHDHKPPHVLILGDFNFPNLKCQEEQSTLTVTEARFLESTRDAVLYQHVMKPTRHRLHQTANILDIVFSNEEDMVNELEVRDPLGKSDHCKYHCQTLHTEMSPEKYLYYKAYYEKMKTKMSEECTEDAWTLMTKRLELAHGGMHP